MAGVQRLLGGAARYLELSAKYYLLRRTPILVFSMERTGSVALHQSLLARRQFTIASHYFDPAKPARGRRAGTAQWAGRHILARRRPARVITLVRNPVENMLSVFARTSLGAGGAGDAASRFAAEYLDAEKYRHQLTWFDKEFRAALGVDVFAHPFDKQRGWTRIVDGPYEVLVLRTELNDASKGAALPGAGTRAMRELAMRTPKSVPLL